MMMTLTMTTTISLGVSCYVICVALYAVSALAKGKEKITVTTIEDPPWVLQMKKDRPDLNSDFSGFIPDLLDMVANHANISYTLKLVDDRTYGKKRENNEWTGMIGEVMTGKADLAAAALTISPERSEVIAFTDPFRTFSSAVVMLKTPADGGSSSSVAPISSIKDLSDRKNISIGVLKGGVTEAFFLKATESTLKQIADRMRADPSLNVDTTVKGIDKVRASGGKYAFIMESPTAEYLVTVAPCDLLQFGLDLDQRSYAWGMKTGSRLREPINRAFAALKQNGELAKLEDKWRNPTACSTAAQGIEPQSLQFAFLLFSAVVSSRCL